MSKHAKHVPQHRAAPVRPTFVETPRRALRTTVVLSSVAVAATGVTISGGMISAPAGVSTAADQDLAAELPAAFGDAAGAGAGARDAGIDPATRIQTVSRSDRRDAADPVKEAALAQDADRAMTATEDLSDEDPRDIAAALLPEFGFSQDQFGCLDALYTRESDWTYNADNPTSSAYGIPQALPGYKMATAGADWATNPVTQIRWGLGYIRDVYGSPCGAWGHSESVGWY